MKSIIIADDHAFTLQGTKSFVESIGFRVLETCNNGITALNLINVHQPHIAILDIGMPGLDGLEVLRKIKEQSLKAKVILITMHKDKAVYNKAIELGASGYILKEQAETELEKCLLTIYENKSYYNQDLDQELRFNKALSSDNNTKELTLSEKKVLELVSQQKTSQQIADLLFISVKTVEGHRRNIIEKLGLPKEKYSLLIWAIQHIKEE